MANIPEDQMNADQLASAYSLANDEAKSFAQTMSGIMAKQGIMGKEAKIYRDYTKSVAEGMRENLDAAGQLEVMEQARTALMQKLAKEGLKVNQIFGKMADHTKEQLKNTAEVESTTKTIKDLEEERLEAIKSLNQEFTMFGAAFGEYSNLARDPKMIGVVAMTALFAAIGAVGKAIRDTQKELGLGGKQSLKMAGDITAVNVQLKMMGVDAEESAAAVKSIYLNTSLTGTEARHAAMNVAVLTEAFGMSADQAAEMTEASKEAGLNVDDMAIGLAKSRDVAPAKVLANMAGSMDQIALFGKEGARSFTEAAVGASQLGIEVSSIVSAGKGLLDVESSIEKQMEAEVLLGRKLNLEKARAAALSGDQATVMEEILKNVGSIEEFQALDTIQKQAMADALNMSVPEILKMAENQEKIAGLSAEAKAHFAETGEILKENQTISEGAKQGMIQFSMAIAQAVAQALVLKGMNKWMGGGANVPGTKDKTKLPSTDKTENLTGDKTKGMSKGMKPGKLIQGAAAILILAAALLVFAFAAKMLSDEINWGNVFIAIGALTLLGIVAALLGQLAANILLGSIALLVMSIALIPLAFAFMLISEVPIGTMFAFVGAVVLLGLAAAGLGFLAMFIFMGAAAIAALGLAIMPMALAFKLLEAVDMEMVNKFFSESLPQLVAIAPGLALAGLGMALFGVGVMAFAVGIAILSPFIATLTAFGETLPMLTAAILPLAALGASLFTVALGIGSIAFSILGLAVALLILTPMIPILMILGGVLGAAATVFSGSLNDSGGGESKEDKLINKLDEVLVAIKEGGVINMDGQKVGEIIGLSGAGAMD
jgi:MFS family permease